MYASAGNEVGKKTTTTDLLHSKTNTTDCEKVRVNDSVKVEVKQKNKINNSKTMRKEVQDGEKEIKN